MLGKQLFIWNKIYSNGAAAVGIQLCRPTCIGSKSKLYQIQSFNRRRLTKAIFTHHEQRILQKIIHVLYISTCQTLVITCRRVSVSQLI